MPQILKMEVKDGILESALDRFLSKGYRSASMQEIAEGAGIAAGNIYNYFKNKEELLTTLIAPVLAEVKAIFEIYKEDMPAITLEDGIGVAGKKMDAFVKVYQKHRKVFVLLFEKSDSTKFETTKADVIESFSEAIIRAKNTFTPQPATPEQEMLIRAFATAYISGVISIITAKTDEDAKLLVLYRFLPFMRTTLISNLR